MFHRAFCAAGLLACLTQPALADHASIGFGSDGAGPINTVSATTMPQGALSLSLNTDFIRADRFSDSTLTALAGEHIHAHSNTWLATTTAGLAYGINEDLTFSLRLPFIYRKDIRAGNHSHNGGIVTNSTNHLGDSSGFGDVSAFGKYRFWNQDGLQAALIFGIKAPTGRRGNRSGGEKLETEHQPGSGSWDQMLGLSLTHKMGPYSFDASTMFVRVGKGSQGTDLGNRLQYNLAASYRIGGEAHDHGDMVHQHESWDAVLEFNGEWSDRKEASGRPDRDSGGNEAFISPGVRYSPDGVWAAHVSFGVPIVTNLGAGHSGTAYKITAGISRSF